MGIDEERALREARETILSRRARFVAAALASAGIATAACGESSGDNERSGSGGTGGAVDGGAPNATGDSSTGGTGGIDIEPVDAGSSDAAPQPCLSSE